MDFIEVTRNRVGGLVLAQWGCWPGHWDSGNERVGPVLCLCSAREVGARGWASGQVLPSMYVRQISGGCCGLSGHLGHWQSSCPVLFSAVSAPCGMRISATRFNQHEVCFLGNAISKYWIYKWVHVSNLQTCCISSGFTQTVPSEEQASL